MTKPPISSLGRIERTVKEIAATCVENEAYFCELDSAAGDGDFGYSLARGFEIVLENWDTYDRTTPGVFLQKVATTMSSRIGGSSGPIWGTAFIRAASAIAGQQELTGEDAVRMLTAAVDGIQARGGASVGDKTLLDALVPLTAAIAAQVASNADTPQVLAAAVAAAEKGAEDTKPLQARRGRASYTGERSIGSPDPGAVAVAVLTRRIADTW
jgi:dihydroxyacetone kinase phosphoprotein-dependent L subunit